MVEIKILERDTNYEILHYSDSATALVWERYMKVIASCLVKIYHN